LYDTSILAASSFARPVSPFSLFSELYPRKPYAALIRVLILWLESALNLAAPPLDDTLLAASPQHLRAMGGRLG
jgi:hypothetical protein